MKKIPDKSVDLILTDPPYNTLNCSWDKNIDVDKLFKEYWRILKNPGVILIFADVGKFMSKVVTADKNYKYTLIWKKQTKTGFLNCKKAPLHAAETINVFYKKCVYNPQMIKGKKHCSHNKKSTGGDAYGRDVKPGTNYEIRDEYYPTNILEFDALNCSTKLHTSEKPIDLLEWLIKSYSNDGAVVMDTFMGSGSTGVAAKNLERHFIGIEMDENYYKIANDRINNNK